MYMHNFRNILIFFKESINVTRLHLNSFLANHVFFLEKKFKLKMILNFKYDEQTDIPFKVECFTLDSSKSW